MVVWPETISSNGHRLVSSPDLQQIRNLKDYYEVYQAGIAKPLNSRQLTWAALSDPEPTKDDTGYTSLKVFTGRNDKHQVFGIAYTINAIAESFRAAAANPYHDKGIVFWGQSGSGKSNLVDVIIKSVETKAQKLPFLYGVPDCPINEEPLNLLNLKGAKNLLSEGVEPQKDLCPRCQVKYHNCSDKELERLLVKPLQFRSRTGEQIVRLQASDTASRITPEGRDRLIRSVMSSNRGLLILDEFGDHPISFLDEIKDLVRDGDLKVNGLIYPMDLVTVGHTTDKEWKGIVDDVVNRSIAERYHPIAVPYNVDTSAEAQIYQKNLNVLPNLPHISPDTVETWAELAVSTRLAESTPALTIQYNILKTGKKELLGDLSYLKDDEAKRRIRINLYRGDIVPGFRQADTKVFQMEGITNEEGTKGLSPVSARNLLVEMAANNEECLSALSLFQGMEVRLEKDAKVGFLGKSEWKKVLDPVRQRWEGDLRTTVLSAFRDDMDEKIQTKTESYLEESDYLMNKSLPRRLNTHNEEIPVNLALIEKTEISIFGRKLSNEERGRILTSNTRDKTAERAKFDEGIKKIVVQEGSFRPEDALMAFPRNEKEQAFCQEAVDHLKEQGFCQSCARESIEYVAQMLRKSQKK